MRKYKNRTEDKKKARKIRKEGCSLSEIAEEVNASKGQVSVWVRDVELSKEAKKILDKKNPATKEYHKNNNRQNWRNAEKTAETFRNKRRKYQQEGREEAKKNNPIHRGACMLYWAEGTKDRTSIGFTNSDVNMIIVFQQFLKENFGLTNANFSISLNFHDDIHTKEEVMNYWSEELGVSLSCFIKPYINQRSKVSKQQRGKIEWGTCRLNVKGVKSVRIIQHIYGAIKEYVGIEDENLWLN